MKDSSRKVLFSLVVGFIMVTSVIGIMFVNYGSGSEPLTYKGYKFIRQPDGSLTTEIDGKVVSFLYLPSEVEVMNVRESIISRIKSSRMVYLASDYYGNHSRTVGIAQYNLGVALRDLQSVYVVQGFFQNATALPVITCRNSTSFVPVISFVEGNSTGFFEEGDCIVVVSDSDDGFIRARDRLVYGVSGVLNGRS